MSHKEVEESKHHFIRAKKETPKAPKTTYLDGIKVSDKDKNKTPIEFHFKDLGKLTEDTNGSFAMRKVYPDGRIEFFVKFATAGPAVGRMLNPWGVNYNIGDEIKFERTMGRKRYEFRKVPETIFNSYMSFLKTHNERYILTAEREINNA